MGTDRNVSKINFTEKSTVDEVINDPAFGNFGRLLFPIDRQIKGSMTLAEVSTSSVYVWYVNIKPEKTVEIINHLKKLSLSGMKIFFPIYTQEEIKANPDKANTGLFFFRGERGREYALMSAGGGFMYVGAMHDSFPHALEVSKRGYNAFALIYRPRAPYEDLARALCFINDNIYLLGVKSSGYSLWGGSAGAYLAAVLGNKNYLKLYTKRSDIPQASAVIMQYIGPSDVYNGDLALYACMGTEDGKSNWHKMQEKFNSLKELGIPAEFHVYEGLKHGFGLGTGTVAEGWINDAINFWQLQINRKK